MHMPHTTTTAQRGKRRLAFGWLHFPGKWLKTPAHAHAVLALTCLIPSAAIANPAAYAWRSSPSVSSPQPSIETLAKRIAPPSGFRRVPVDDDSFAAWLRGLPMKPAGSPVMLYTGTRKWRQDAHVAVVDIDVGKRDLQQCADAVMRLRAEYLWSKQRKTDIGFNYTGGGHVTFSRWARGDRPSESGKSWRRRGKPDSSYKSLRRYMVQIFAYAGTYSLAKELKPIARADLQAGDVFIKGGFPGHAVLITDVVENPETGERRFLLLQSYMPAQDMHILINPASSDSSPWYPAKFSGDLITPEWTFKPGSLKRWPND